MTKRLGDSGAKGVSAKIVDAFFSSLMYGADFLIWLFRSPEDRGDVNSPKARVEKAWAKNAPVVRERSLGDKVKDLETRVSDLEREK